MGGKSFIKFYENKRKTFLLFSLVNNFYIDLKLYYKHSTIFKYDTFEKIEALIILRYHSLEKGMLHDVIRYQYGKQNVIELSKLLKNRNVVANSGRTQINAAYLVMCTYYQLHQKPYRIP